MKVHKRIDMHCLHQRFRRMARGYVSLLDSGFISSIAMVLVLPVLLFSADYVYAEHASPKTSIGFQAEISVMGESALIDKETGRLFWEGGSSSTLVESTESKVKSHVGIEHLRATILTGTLLMAVLGYLSFQIHDRLNSWTILDTNSSPSRMIAGVCLSLFKMMLQYVPKSNPAFVFVVYFLYMAESFSCSTKTYLRNAVYGPIAIESYLREMKNVRPVVEWKVRCFHYSARRWFIPFKAITDAMSSVQPATPVTSGKATILSFLFRRKIISSVNKGCFHYKLCDDKTIVAVWKRSLQTRVPAYGNTAAPLIKLVLSKVVALADEKTRNEYLFQQRNFVRRHAQADEYAEFSTSIDFARFKPRLLILRSVKTHPARKILCTSYMFWFFTILGLTVPYRRFLASNCDVLRLVIVKETSCNEPFELSPFSWLTTKTLWTTSDSMETGTGNFETIMRNLQLYTNNSIDETTSVASDLLAGSIKGIAFMNRSNVPNEYEANI